MFQIFVQREIAQTFIEKFVDKTSQLRVGDPLEEQTFCGAVNSKVHYEKVMSYIRLASKDGATLHCGETLNSNKHSRQGSSICWKRGDLEHFRGKLGKIPLKSYWKGGTFKR